MSGLGGEDNSARDPVVQYNAASPDEKALGTFYILAALYIDIYDIYRSLPLFLS